MHGGRAGGRPARVWGALLAVALAGSMTVAAVGRSEAGTALAGTDLAGTAAPAAVPLGALAVWVSPAGADTNDGLTPATPFQTLGRASDFLCGGPTGCTTRGRPVVVKLAQTTFRPVLTAATARVSVPLGGDLGAAATPAPFTTAVNWRYVDPDFTTRFEPWSYTDGDGWSRVAATGGYPTLDGGFRFDLGFVVTPQVELAGRDARLDFRYLRFTRFNVGGVMLNGDTTSAVVNGVTVVTGTARTVNAASFYGVSFDQIGNLWFPTHPMGFGGLLVSNSARVTVRNSHFTRLQNRATDQDTIHVHGIYFSHGSGGAQVVGNEFTDITGDAVRQRDRSHGILVQGNVFTRAGAFGYFDDYYCKPSSAASICFPKEFRSYGGVFTGNTLRGLYPQGIPGRRTVFCHDQPTGLCPADRIAVR